MRCHQFPLRTIKNRMAQEYQLGHIPPIQRYNQKILKVFEIVTEFRR